MNIKKIDDAKLQEAIVHFESMHGAIEEVCPWFVEAIVEYAKKVKENVGCFTDFLLLSPPLCKSITVNITLENIRENKWSAICQGEYDRLEDVLHPVILGDEIDVLIVEIVRTLNQ